MSSLTKKDDIERVLKYPGMVIARDVVGIFRETNVLTNKRSLDSLVNKITKRVLSEAVMSDPACRDLQRQLKNPDGGDYAPAGAVSFYPGAAGNVRVSDSSFLCVPAHSFE